MEISARALLLFLGFALCGCSTRLLLVNNGALDGEVEGNDDNYVYIVLDEPDDADDLRSHREELERNYYAEARTSPDGERGDTARLYRVPHEAVTGIRFAGGDAALIGGLLVGAGLLATTIGAIRSSTCERELCELQPILFAIIPGGTIGALGAAMMTAGLVMNQRAKDRARRAPEYSVAPVVIPTPESAAAAIVIRGPTPWP